MGKVRVGAGQLPRFEARKRGGKHLGPETGERMAQAHPRAIAPEQRTRAAPRVLDEPAGAAAQRPARRSEIEDGGGERQSSSAGQHSSGDTESTADRGGNQADDEARQRRTRARKTHGYESQACRTVAGEAPER